MPMWEVARCDTEHPSWEGSGYVLAKEFGVDRFVLGDVNHCSCYGTWCNREFDGATEVWSGSWKELVRMAKVNEDPQMKGRTIEGDDLDAQDMREIYKEVLNYDSIPEDPKD